MNPKVIYTPVLVALIPMGCYSIKTFTELISGTASIPSTLLNDIDRSTLVIAPLQNKASLLLLSVVERHLLPYLTAKAVS